MCCISPGTNNLHGTRIWRSQTLDTAKLGPQQTDSALIGWCMRCPCSNLQIFRVDQMTKAASNMADSDCTKKNSFSRTPKADDLCVAVRPISLRHTLKVFVRCLSWRQNGDKQREAKGVKKFYYRGCQTLLFIVR